MDATTLDHRLWAEHRRDPLGERLGAVNDEQHAARHVETPVGEVGQQAGHQGLVLGGALHHRQRNLGALGGGPQRSDQLVLGARPLPTLFNDRSRWPQIADPLLVMSYIDFAGDLAEDILAKVDRASMGVSLEVRCPLLDHRVAEFAWRLPMYLKVQNGERKWLMRRVLERHVPRALTDRPKRGFGMPVGDWLRGPLHGWAEEMLDEGRLKREGWLAPAPIRRIWREHEAGRRDRTFLLWNLLMFQAWIDAQCRT